MSKETVISERELETLKSHGTVYVCRSCRDFKNTIVLLEYKKDGLHQLFDGFCKSCIDAMNACDTCSKKSRK